MLELDISSQIDNTLTACSAPRLHGINCEASPLYCPVDAPSRSMLSACIAVAGTPLYAVYAAVSTAARCQTTTPSCNTDDHTGSHRNLHPSVSSAPSAMPVDSGAAASRPEQQPQQQQQQPQLQLPPLELLQQRQQQRSGLSESRAESRKQFNYLNTWLNEASADELSRFAGYAAAKPGAYSLATLFGDIQYNRAIGTMDVACMLAQAVAPALPCMQPQTLMKSQMQS